jgi:biopolymer transport protein TolR
VPVNLPDARAKALDQDQEPVQLSIDRTGKLFLGDEEIADAALAGRLEQVAAAARGAEPPQIYLRADRGLDYGRVMRVMGELNRAGLNRVALVTGQDSGDE